MKKIVVLAALVVGLIDAHGMMMDPINRSSAWRQNFTNPVNYDDNELYCGGVSVSSMFFFFTPFTMLII